MLFAVFLLSLSAFCLFVEADYKFPNMTPNRHTIVHLFEWKWNDIADECERFLGPYGYGGVQTSPPNENAIIWQPPDNHEAKRPWWERYQPVSYKLVTRSGNEDEFASMVTRCNKVGVRIYPDVIINHMARNTFKGKGTGGNTCDGESLTYDGVPYTSDDFNSCKKCGTTTCDIENFDDVNQLRNCRLVALNDLDQGHEYVREKIAGFLNHLIDLGVAGFRVDAGKHMWPEDVSLILKKLKNLREDYFPEGSRPFVYQEVPDVSSSSVANNQQYIVNGRVTEFKYGMQISEVFRRQKPMKYLKNFGEEWGLVCIDDAFVFIDNHDNQREAFPHVLTHLEPAQYKMATAFMLAWPYGVPRVMSSFAWERNIQGETDVNSWFGPPHDKDYNIKSPTVNSDNTCGNGWVCEHRWRVMYNMAQFRNVVAFQDVSWWDNGSYQIAFSRGAKGFLAINNEDYPLKVKIQTGLPTGRYCDVISGDYVNGTCTGKVVAVDQEGKVDLDISNTWNDPMIAIHVNAKVQ